ncbi:hypothetical protein D3C71_1730230 [compost metagenome]
MFTDKVAGGFGCLPIRMDKVIPFSHHNCHFIPANSFQLSIGVVLYQFCLTSGLPFCSLTIKSFRPGCRVVRPIVSFLNIYWNPHMIYFTNPGSIITVILK